MVERDDLFREHCRVVADWQAEHEGANPHARRPGGHGSQDD
jgi:hypothetical protein